MNGFSIDVLINLSNLQCFILKHRKMIVHTEMMLMLMMIGVGSVGPDMNKAVFVSGVDFIPFFVVEEGGDIF